MYIGAGSFRFTIPCALNILDFAKTFKPVELWLVDINIESLALMYTAVHRLIQVHKKDIALYYTTDRKKALLDADYVLISISIGIQTAEWFDIHIPLKFGIPQNTGDTVGPGGIMRGLRTIPVMDDILKDVNELCPHAMVLNYTNPQGTLMLSLREMFPKIQSIGLCHEVFYLRRKRFARFLNYCGVDTSAEKEFEIKYGGVNHFSWITKIEYNGKDIYPQMRQGADYGYESREFKRPFNYYLLKKLGYFCYVEDRHVAEFLPQYYNFFNYKDLPFGIKLRNVAGLHRGREFVYSLIRWAIHNRNRWFIKLVTRPMEGGERALLMAKDKERNIPRHHVCNVLNKNIIPTLPENCIVEVPCYFHDGELCPSKIGALPKVVNDMVKIHAENQQLVVNAALSSKPEDVLKALLADPMCQLIEDEEKIEAMMWNMLYFQQKWLPNFKESVPSTNELKKLKYFVDKTELDSKLSARKEKFELDQRLGAKAWPQLE